MSEDGYAIALFTRPTEDRMQWPASDVGLRLMLPMQLPRFCCSCRMLLLLLLLLKRTTSTEHVVL